MYTVNISIHDPQKAEVMNKERERIIPVLPNPMAFFEFTTDSQSTASLQRITPTTLHVIPERAIKNFLSIAGLNFFILVVIGLQRCIVVPHILIHQHVRLM